MGEYVDSTIYSHYHPGLLRHPSVPSDANADLVSRMRVQGFPACVLAVSMAPVPCASTPPPIHPPPPMPLVLAILVPIGGGSTVLALWSSHETIKVSLTLSFFRSVSYASPYPTTSSPLRVVSPLLTSTFSPRLLSRHRRPHSIRD